tara:strand:+ start:1123 stop:1800 length:678 start_codon:yes stop_codon:yes gene_type:complete
MVQTVIFEKYIREVKTSEARKKKYYSFTKAHPKAKKYKDRTKYDWKEGKGKWKGKCLVDLNTGERVIANPNSWGTPNWEVINGQKMYNGDYNPFTRGKIMEAIKKEFKDSISCLTKRKDTVHIEITMYDTIRESKSKSLWDLGNRAFPYVKAIEDQLVDSGIIPDDNTLFVTKSGGARFIPIKDTEKRKIVLTLRPEGDQAILRSIAEVKKEMEDSNKTIIKARK